MTDPAYRQQPEIPEASGFYFVAYGWGGVTTALFIRDTKSVYLPGRKSPIPPWHVDAWFLPALERPRLSPITKEGPATDEG